MTASADVLSDAELIASSLMDSAATTVNDYFYMTGSDLAVEFPEYFLTVNAAHHLSDKFNAVYGYKVLFEQKTRQLLLKSVRTKFRAPFLSGRKNKPKKGFLKGKSRVRNGRVDVAITQSGGFLDEVLSLIELKGVNPAKHGVKKDLQRLVDFMCLENENGRCVIGSTHFFTVHQFTDRSHYERSGLEDTYNALVLSVVDSTLEFKISTQLFKENTMVDEELDEFIGSVVLVGVVVTFEHVTC